MTAALAGWQLFCCSGSEICWHTIAAKFMRERQETLARSNEMAPLTILNRNLSVNLTRRIGYLLIRKHVFWLYLEVTVKGQLNCQVDTWKVFWTFEAWTKGNQVLKDPRVFPVRIIFIKEQAASPPSSLLSPVTSDLNLYKQLNPTQPLSVGKPVVS